MVIIIHIKVNLGELWHITHRLNGGKSHKAMRIILFPNVAHNFGTTRYRQVKDCIQILHFEGYILDTIAMLHQVQAVLLVIGRVSRDKHKDNFILAHRMLCIPSLSGLKSLIAKWFESQTGCIITGRLLGVANVKR